MGAVSRGIDRMAVTFDEDHLVANAGLLLVATLARRLGIGALVDAMVKIPAKRGGFLPGRKVLTLVHAMVAGATHIDHADLLRAGATGQALGHAVMAPSTLGTFLRGFTFGHLRQLDKVLGEVLRRAWSFMALPERLVVDIDSTICEVTGKKKAGAAYGYTKVLGYHPLLATRADTGEVLHARMRKGSANTQRGTKRFVEELVARLRRAGATGEITMRFDSGFWSTATIGDLERLKIHYTLGVRMVKPLVRLVEELPEESWRPVADYPVGGEAQVAECSYLGRRTIVRRTRTLDRHQQLFATWQHFGFVTDLTADALAVDAFHRAHATVELDIRDLKEGAGLEHCPSGNFSANGAWLLCTVLAHNLLRWTQILGGIGDPADARPAIARTVRTRLISMPGQLVNRSGTPTLRTPSRWPWQSTFTNALDTLRALPIAVT